MGVGDQHYAESTLISGKRPGTVSTGGRVGPRAGLGRCGKSRPLLDSITGPPIP
jgi:hypothetical protein